FFSSRRRHTRFSRDWSSDVCSSDLNRRLHSQLAGHLVQAVQLGVGFHVETTNAGFQRPLHFPFLLADTGKHHFSGLATGLQHPLELTGRDNVETGTKPGQHIEYSQVAVGFHGVAHQVRPASQGVVVGLEMALQGSPGIDIGGRTEALGNLCYGDVFGVEFAVTVIEMIHGVPDCSGRIGLSGQLSGLSSLCCVSALFSTAGTGASRYRGPFWPQPETISETSTRAASPGQRTCLTCIPNPLSE